MPLPAHSPLIIDPAQTPPGPPNFQLPWCCIFSQPYSGVVVTVVEIDEVVVLEVEVDVKVEVEVDVEVEVEEGLLSLSFAVSSGSAVVVVPLGRITKELSVSSERRVVVLIEVVFVESLNGVVGTTEGSVDGVLDGAAEGFTEGFLDGAPEGFTEVSSDGAAEGLLGFTVCLTEGAADGFTVGREDGCSVGSKVGTLVALLGASVEGVVFAWSDGGDAGVSVLGINGRSSAPSPIAVSSGSAVVVVTAP